MIGQEAESLIKREMNGAKNASLMVGVVTKSDKLISGTVYNDTGDVAVGDRVFEIGSITKTFTNLLLTKLILNNTIVESDLIK